MFLYCLEREGGIFDIYWNIEKKCRKYTTIFTFYILWNETSFVASLFYSFYCVWCGNYDTSTWPLPFNILVPFDTTSLWGWYLLWFVQFSMGLSYTGCLTAITSYFMSCCLYICAICDHFDFLCDSIMNDVDRNRIEKDQQKYRVRHQQIEEKIGRMIKVHDKIYE